MEVAITLNELACDLALTGEAKAGFDAMRRAVTTFFKKCAEVKRLQKFTPDVVRNFWFIASDAEVTEKERLEELVACREVAHLSEAAFLAILSEALELEHKPLIVSGVLPDAPVRSHDICIGDSLQRYAGYQLGSADHLLALICATKGDRIELTIEREGVSWCCFVPEGALGIEFAD